MIRGGEWYLETFEEIHSSRIREITLKGSLNIAKNTAFC